MIKKQKDEKEPYLVFYPIFIQYMYSTVSRAPSSMKNPSVGLKLLQNKDNILHKLQLGIF